MKIAGINFPEALINALHDGELVIFAGAGVSMGEPARLPNFKYLAKTIAEGTGETLRAGEEIDHFLGRLQDGKVKVHERAAEELDQDNLKSTELHRNLLRLYPSVEKVRIVTTNFDLLFEQAAKEIFDDQPEVFRAPALPLGRQFRGIVHVHGTVSRHAEMVITDADFGRAYLNEGWAQRFLIELFGHFTILFVGYSYNDRIMNYLTRALLPGKTHRRFALTGKCNNDTDRWRLLGIEPVTYLQSSRDDHSALDEGARGLAVLAQYGVLDWHHKITEIAENPPPLDKETEDLIEYALADATKARFFTKVATNPEWIDWLDERDEYLTPLFGDNTLNRRDRIFSRWLVDQFAYDHANKLFLLIGKHNMRLHPDFWCDLASQIARDRENLWDENVLARWISLLLTTAQGHIAIADMVHAGADTLLQLIGKHCIRHGMLDSLLQIFDIMIGSRSQLRGGYLWPNEEETPIDVKLALIGGHRALDEIWKEGLKPKLPQVVETVLNRVIRCLEDRYITLCNWQKADRNWDPTSDSRSAIEPHEQDRFPRAIDVLIDAGRDCLEWLASKQADAAARWCDRLVYSDAPLLRRLAVHGLSKREDLTADDKIDWLQTHIDLHELPIHHEVFQAVKRAYPKISLERREVLIESVRAYQWTNEEDPNAARYTARQHFNWFDWLHKSQPTCTLAKQALDAVLTEYPKFKPKEYPDLMHWMSSDGWELQSPWSPKELLAKPAAHWLDDLLSFQSSEEEHFDHEGIRKSIAGAIRQDFDWGLDLAKAIGRAEKWDVYVWSVLINTWSRMNLTEDQHSKVLSWLGKIELYPKHNHEIAEALYALVSVGSSYALNLLPQANKIAAALWRDLDRTEPTEKWADYQNSPSGPPAGSLVNFWLSGLSLWRDQQAPMLRVTRNEYRRILTNIVRDQSLPGRLGRMILTSQFGLLLDFSQSWTQKNLLPIFNPNSDDFYAAWAGFLTQGCRNSAVAEVMANPFIEAVKRINSDRFNQRDIFIEYYIYMLTFVAEDPLDKWIPKFFKYANQETKDCFAAKVDFRLRNMTEAERQEWWQDWLRCYWKNRLHGVPTGEPEYSEAARMLNWLPHLTSVFPEAVDIAVQMTVSSLQGCYVIEELSINNENDLWQKHPESVVKLLIYLWECDLPAHSWYSGRDLIDNLLSSNISSELKRKLEEIRIQL